MTTSTWNASANGDWSNAADWTGGVPNSSTATATIAESGTYTVDIASTETFSVGSITLNDAHAVLEIDGTLNLAGTLTQTAGNVGLSGTINGGTINTGSYSLYSNGGTLNGVSVDGTITLDVPQTSLALPNGLSMHGAGGTGNGTIDFNNENSYLLVDGTISNATINAGFGGQHIVDYQDNGTITFASTTTINSQEYDGLTINGVAGSIVNNGTINAAAGIVTISAATFTNAGTIDASFNNGANYCVTIEGQNFDNSGTIAISNGALLEITSNVITNTGSISVDGTSTLIIQSAITTAELGKLNLASGASLDFSGGLNNAGATLSLAGDQLLGQVDGGTIEGTINFSSLTLGGDVAFEGADGTGAGTINLTGHGGILVLEGAMTLSNVTINFGSALALDTITPNGTGSVTLASSVTVDIAASDGNSSNGALIGENYNGSPEGVITSDATINDTTSGAQLTIYDVQSFTNAGTINVSNGNVLNIGESGVNVTGFNNTGSINIDGTSTVSLSETDSVLQGTIGGTGALTFTGGSQTINSGASLSVSNWTLSGSDTTTVNTSLSYGGTFSAGAGTTLTIASGDTFTLSGTSTLAGAIDGPGKFALSGGTAMFDAGASIGSGLAISGTAKVAANASVAVTGALSEGASGTLTIAPGDTLTLSGTGSIIAGTVTGSGTLALSGGTDTVSAGASLGVSDLSLSSGASVSLKTSLTYAGQLSEAGGTTLALGAYTFRLSGAGSTIAGSVSGSAALAFAGGSQALNSGAALTVARWTTSGSDAATVNETLSYGGTFSAGTGTTLTIASGDVLTLGGTSTFSGAISGSGATLAFSGGSQTLNIGTSFGVSDWTLSGNAAAALKESLSYAGTFSAGAGTTLNIASNDNLTLTGGASFAGSTSGSGTLILSGTAETFTAGAHFGSALGIRSGATVTVDGAVSVSGALTEAAGTTIAIGSGDTLTLSGSGSSLVGAINGTGTLAFAGGTASFSSGASLGVSDVSLSSGAAVGLKTSLHYAGDLSEASGTTLALGAYTLNLSGAGSIISGMISGTGTLALTGGSQAFDAGAALKEAKWSMSGSDVASLNENLSFSGTCSEGSGATLMIASGDTLSLTGTATLGATINGAGTIALSNATLLGLAVGGTVTLDDVGMVLQTGQITLGDASGNAATLTIANSASYTINANVGIGIGTSTATAIDDNGLLIKNGGTGTSKIAVGIVDNGHIEAATGTLDLVQTVTGSGAMQVDAGATLEFGSSAASTLGMTFNGANATLALASPSSFAATIAGFAAGDTIDLVAIKATLAVLENGDQLLITNGANTVATLQLTGTYTGYIFNAVSDGHGGTDITATAPGAHTTIYLDEHDSALTAVALRQFEAHASDWYFG